MAVTPLLQLYFESLSSMSPKHVGRAALKIKWILAVLNGPCEKFSRAPLSNVKDRSSMSQDFPLLAKRSNVTPCRKCSIQFSNHLTMFFNLMPRNLVPIMNIMASAFTACTRYTLTTLVILNEYFCILNPWILTTLMPRNRSYTAEWWHFIGLA